MAQPSGSGSDWWPLVCNCANCARFRRGELLAQARTQSSITVSADGIDWVLINASPDIREQIAAFPPLQPGRGVRDTGIHAVILNDAKIGRNCLIGSNALITEGKEIPDNSLVVGSPGKVVRELTEQEIEENIEFSDRYVRNLKRYNESFAIQQAILDGSSS